MNERRFENYEAAKEYFEVSIPRKFVEILNEMESYASVHHLDFEELASDLFELFRIEGHSSRYQQTPPEFFPFAGNGCDGEHFGFIIHVENQQDYPTGFFCPMDSEGVILLGNNTLEAFQKLLGEGSENIEKHGDFIQKLGLKKNLRKSRFDGEWLRPIPPPQDGWRWVETSDGAGIFAPSQLFQSNHVSFQWAHKNVRNSAAYFQELAEEQGKEGFYGSQLYYLKELFWDEWTNPRFAIEILKAMRGVYEKLERAHLFKATGKIIDDFVNVYSKY